ncbi:hypothetical protein DIPPA_09888 [Diplonema papillatum]|nr:hypothetical protein DIPPA_09888 [Diplonema papillatum]|eukprot:gene20109-30909_t
MSKRKATEEARSQVKVKKAEERRLVTGEAGLEHTEVEIDEDAWDDEYQNQLENAGVPKVNVKRFVRHVSCSLSWKTKWWRYDNQQTLGGDWFAVNLDAIILKKSVVTAIGDGLVPYILDALNVKQTAASNPRNSRSHRRTIIIFEDSRANPAVSLLTHDSILSIHHLPSAVAVGQLLVAFTCYIAKAPYKIHSHEPKTPGAKVPHEIFAKMLGTVPSLGLPGVRAVLEVYPTVAHLLGKYADAAVEEETKRSMLADLPLGDGTRLGPALSAAIYYTFVVPR